MARDLQVTGLDEFGQLLEDAGSHALGIAKGSLFEGAAVVADAMRASLNQIKTEPFRWASENDKRYPSPEEKAAVMAAKYGIARFAGSGAEVNTIVGVAGSGYVHLMGKEVPAVVILRSIQSGTSFMKAQPVVRKALRAAVAPASAKIAAAAEARLQKLFK